MPVSNKLSAMQCEKAAPQGKKYKLPDGDGLFLVVHPSGKKVWLLRHYVGGRQKDSTLGEFPGLSLKAARLMAGALRAEAQKEQDENPQPTKKAPPSESFSVVAMDWFHGVHATQVVPAHAERNLSRLEKLVLPYLGKHRADDITPPMVLDVLKRICDRGNIETAHRVKSIISLIFRYGISLGRAERDPTRDLTGLLPSSKTEHHPALLDPQDLGSLLRMLDGYSGSPITTAAARFLPLVFCRPGEMLHMTWQEVDPKNAQWVWIAAKTRTQMITPLSRQAMQILAGLRPLTGEGLFVFPSLRSQGKPLSNTAIKGALDSLGYRGRMTSHGWRAVARTHLVETLGYPENIVEMQLGHSVRDALGRAYNRTTFLDQRREMMQAWADWLDGLRDLAAPAVSQSVEDGDPWEQWGQ